MKAVVCVAALCFLCSLGPGYGGFGATALFTDVSALERKLTALNTGAPPEGWAGKDTVSVGSPLRCLSGHGGGLAGDLSVAGGGALTVNSIRVDSLAFLFSGIAPSLMLGYVWEPTSRFWIRPGVDVNAWVWGCYAHSHESFCDPDFARWLGGWSVGLAPGLEIMGKLLARGENYLGCYIKAGYQVPVQGAGFGAGWGAELRLRGLMLELGLRFNRGKEGPLRI